MASGVFYAHWIARQAVHITPLTCGDKGVSR
jgi:hypothetical protein